MIFAGKVDRPSPCAQAAAKKTIVTKGPKKIWPNRALVKISLRPFFGMRRVICAYQTCACVVFLR